MRFEFVVVVVVVCHVFLVNSCCCDSMLSEFVSFFYFNCMQNLCIISFNDSLLVYQTDPHAHLTHTHTQPMHQYLSTDFHKIHNSAANWNGKCVTLQYVLISDDFSRICRRPNEMIRIGKIDVQTERIFTCSGRLQENK